MKKLVLFLFIILITATAWAQNNVNVDNYRFRFTYRSLPSKPLTPMLFYYGVYINVPNSVTRFVDLNNLSDQLVIEGQRRTDELRAGDVAVTLDMGSVNIVSSDIKEREGDWIDDNDRRKGKRRYYLMEIAYTFEAKVTLTQDGRKPNSYTLYNRINSLTYKTKEYRSRRELSDYWKNNRENLRETFTRDLALQAVSKANTQLTKLYGFPTSESSDIIKTINEKKHPENIPFRAASDNLKSKLEAMDAYNLMMEEDVADLISYYENILVRYADPKLKADVRLRYAALYNLCKIYLYLEQPENVKQYADLILENGYDTGDCKKMNEAADKLVLLFNSSEIVKTRHFNPDDYYKD